MIAGIGTDICDLARFQKLVEQETFIKRVLTRNEQQKLASLPAKTRQVEFLAGRFACKEAFSKALGTGISQDVSFQDLEILNDNRGAPYFAKAPQSDKYQIHVSISHTNQMAIAFVVLEVKKELT